MKIYGKIGSAVAVAAMAASGFLATTAPASATSQPEARVYTASSDTDVPAELIGPNGEKPTEWGVAAVSLDSAGTVTPMASKEVGGGTWSYGTTLDGALKGCYSNYIHPSKKHSASIAIANGTDKDIRDAGIWAEAYGTAGGAYTCYTYWGVY